MLARLGVCLRRKLSPTIPATAAKSAMDRYNKFAFCVKVRSLGAAVNRERRLTGRQTLQQAVKGGKKEGRAS